MATTLTKTRVLTALSSKEIPTVVTNDEAILIHLHSHDRFILLNVDSLTSRFKSTVLRYKAHVILEVTPDGNVCMTKNTSQPFADPETPANPKAPATKRRKSQAAKGK